MLKASHLLALLACGPALFLVPGPSRAETEQEGTFWTGYMSSWWVDPSWGLWFDTHYNVDTFFVLRGGVTHAFDAGPSVTGGYAWALLNPDFERQEHRPWAQLFVPMRLNDDWTLSMRFRVDFRFPQSLEDGEIVDGYDFIFRTRYQTTFTRRFAAMRYGQPLVQLAHEILLDAYASPARPVVDQNRISLLFGLDMGHLTVRVGYMNRYLPNARGGNGLLEHAALLWFSQSIDLSERRRRRKQPKYDYEDFPEYGGP